MLILITRRSKAPEKREQGRDKDESARKLLRRAPAKPSDCRRHADDEIRREEWPARDDDFFQEEAHLSPPDHRLLSARIGRVEQPQSWELEVVEEESVRRGHTQPEGRQQADEQTAREGGDQSPPVLPRQVDEQPCRGERQ